MCTVINPVLFRFMRARDHDWPFFIRIVRWLVKIVTRQHSHILLKLHFSLKAVFMCACVCALFCRPSASGCHFLGHQVKLPIGRLKNDHEDYTNTQKYLVKFSGMVRIHFYYWSINEKQTSNLLSFLSVLFTFPQFSRRAKFCRSFSLSLGFVFGRLDA